MGIINSPTFVSFLTLSHTRAHILAVGHLYNFVYASRLLQIIIFLPQHGDADDFEDEDKVAIISPYLSLSLFTSFTLPLFAPQSPCLYLAFH